MRATIRVMLAAGLVAAMLGPMKAQAALNSECGGNYSHTTACMFTAVGPNLMVMGNSTAGTMRVRISDPLGTVTIVSCDGGYSCYGQLGIDPSGTDSAGPPPGVGPLLCTVITSGSGYYRCQSNV